MTKKKVLFVATVDSHIELFHLPFLKMFKEHGYEVHVATDTDKPIKYCDKKICLPIRRSPFRLSNFKAIRQLRKVMFDEGYEIVHCHTPMGGVVARMAGKKARKNGTRMIYTAHGFHFYKGAPAHYWLMFYPVEKYLAKYTDTLITINNEDFERAKRKFGKRCADIQYVPGVGVDPKKFEKKMSAKAKSKLRAELGLSDDDKVLICVGRLDKNKNQGFLIKAMRELLEKDDKYRLLLVGPDELDGKYQKLAKDLGVSKEVLFLGFRKDIPELMQISDVAVSASKREGLPVNLIEAGMAGLPIVALDCRGVRDVCEMVGGRNASVLRLNDGIGFTNVLEHIQKGDNRIDMSCYRNNVVGDAMDKIYGRKRRVLHVLASDRFSGAENVACMIIRNLSDEFDMAYCSPRGPIEGKLKEMGIKYFGLEKLSRRNLKRVIEAFNPDIIHAHDFRASVIVASWFQNQGMIISHIHQDNPKIKSFSVWAILYKYISLKICKIIWVSEDALKNYYFSHFVEQKSIVLQNVVDVNYIKTKATEYNIGEEYDVLFLGRLVALKNPKRALHIISLVKERKDDVRMAIVGEGEESTRLREYVLKNGLEKNVKMLGFQENPYPVLNNSKLLIITSEREGVPMAVFEAQALGKPVIGVKIDGLNKIIKDNENGYLSNNDRELSNRILQLLDNDNYGVLLDSLQSSFIRLNNENKFYCRIIELYNRGRG
ncbi:glycosyltransferase [Candidatus Saccharibacteria bacterium]|nr:glycosyltransferase [Candidatus Saccharibacteria bacterium]